jgi:hypothetical protein
MSDRLTIRVAGKNEHIAVSSFLDIMQNTLVVLEGITKSLRTSDTNAVEWRIVSASMNSPLAVTIEGHVDGNPSPVPENVVHACMRGFKQIEESDESTPQYFNVSMLDAVKKIGYVLLNDGVRAVTFVPDDMNPVTPTPQFYAHVMQLIPQGYSEIGSLEGRLEVLSIHRKNYFAVYDRFTGKRVECTFENADLQKAKEAFGRRVNIYGRIRYNRESQPESVSVEPNGIEVIPEQHELPQFADLEGLDITGGVDPAEYVRSLRDDAR